MQTKNKKGQVGIGVLILFISSLFIAAIAAGVFITTNSAFQAKAKTTGDQTQKDVSSMFFVMDVVGSDGRDGDIEYLKQIIKLPPGSDAINMDYLTVVLSSETTTASLNYRGITGTTTLGNDGFNTWINEEVGELIDYHTTVVGVVDDTPLVTINLDIDFDGVNEQIAVCRPGSGICEAYSGTHILIRLSTAGDFIIPLIDDQGGPLSLVVKDGELFGNVLTPIGDYGYISITGSENDAGGSYTILGDNIHIFAKPHMLNEDLDDDGLDDSLVINDTHVIVHLSSKGNISQQLNARAGLAYSLGADISSAPTTLNNYISLQDNESSKIFGYINISGTSTSDSYIDDDVQFTVIPFNINKGYYSASYPQRAADNQEGMIKVGDVVRLYYESPVPLNEDEKIIVTLMTRSGTTTRTEFYMPNIILSESTTIYP